MTELIEVEVIKTGISKFSFTVFKNGELIAEGSSYEPGETVESIKECLLLEYK